MASGTVASGTAPRPAVEVKLPSNANANPDALLIGVGCTGSGFCTAGGSYNDLAGHSEPTVVSESRGRWARAIELRLPSNAEVNPLAEVNSVACTGTGQCAAVGYYNGDTRFQGFIATESKGRWQRARLAPLPPNTAPSTDFQINGVSCSGPGACVAVGNYKDSSGHFDAMAVTESKGKFGNARELPLPSDAGADPGAFVLRVDCPKTGFCVATADYNNKKGVGKVAIMTESGGRWRSATELRLPSDEAASHFPGLDSVTCAKVGSCLAIGGYTLKGGGFRPMVATDAKGRWKGLAKITRPAGRRAVYGPELIGIACQGLASCVAVGRYKTTAGGFPPMTATRSGGRWTRAFQVMLPANSATGASVVARLYDVACPRVRLCMAVGFYTDKLGHLQAMADATPA